MLFAYICKDILLDLAKNHLSQSNRQMYSKLHEQTMNLNNVRKVRIGVQIRYNHVDDNFNSSNVLPTFFFLVRNHIFKDWV